MGRIVQKLEGVPVVSKAVLAYAYAFASKGR